MFHGQDKNCKFLQARGSGFRRGLRCLWLRGGLRILATGFVAVQLATVATNLVLGFLLGGRLLGFAGWEMTTYSSALGAFGIRCGLRLLAALLLAVILHGLLLLIRQVFEILIEHAGRSGHGERSVDL